MAGWLEILKTIAPYVSAGGQVVGAIGAGRTQGRAQENAQTMGQDQAALDRYRIEQLARMSAANLTEQATQDRANRVLTNSKDRAQQVGLGELLQNLQDVNISGMPSYIPKIQFSGGLRPSALGPLTRQAGGNLARTALQAQMSGSDIPMLPDTSGLGTDAPAQSPLQQSGRMDDILNWIGMASLPFQAFEAHQQEQKREQERREREAALMSIRSQRTTPAAVPTNLAQTTGLFGS